MKNLFWAQHLNKRYQLIELFKFFGLKIEQSLINSLDRLNFGLELEQSGINWLNCSNLGLKFEPKVID